MNRRLMAAVAALGVVALVVFGPAVAAQAGPPSAPLTEAPGPPCTVKEWADPTNFKRCTEAAFAATQAVVQCLNAPTPTGPDTGFAGMVSVRPDASLYAGMTGQYTQYGAGGYHLDTYDLGCVGDVTHATAVAQNGVADTVFQASAGWLATANTTRGYAYDPHAMWGWFDGDLDTAVHAMYQNVWLTGAAVFVMLAGVWLIWRARRGDVSEATATAGWVLLVAVGVTLVVQWPSASARIADTAATAGLQTVHAGAGLGPQTAAPTECRALSPEACVDHRTPSDRMSDSITTALLYHNWLVAELGSADSPTAKKYGPALYSYQALTWGEAADIRANPELRKIVTAEKAQHWNQLAAVIKDEDPQAYEHLQGLHGSDRLFVAFLTAVEVFLFTSFDLVASLAIILAFAVFRFVIITLPITGAAGVFPRTSGYLIKSLNAALAAFRNILAFGAASTLFLFLVNAYFAADALPGIAKTILMGLTAAGMWLLVLYRNRLTGRLGFRRPADRAGETPDREPAPTRDTTVLIRRPASARPATYAIRVQASVQAPPPRRPQHQIARPAVHTGQVLPAARPARAITSTPQPPRSS
jgi:hypothetical protein